MFFLVATRSDRFGEGNEFIAERSHVSQGVERCFQHRVATRKIRFLRNVADTEPAASDDPSAVRSLEPCDDPQEGALASPIGADESDPLAFEQLEAEVSEYLLRSVALARSLNGQDGLGHRSGLFALLIRAVRTIQRTQMPALPNYTEGARFLGRRMVVTAPRTASSLGDLRQSGAARMPESDAESERAVGADGVVRFFAQVRGDLWPERPLTGAASSSVQGESGGSPSDPSSCAALFSTHVSWRAGPAVSPSA